MKRPVQMYVLLFHIIKHSCFLKVSEWVMFHIKAIKKFQLGIEQISPHYYYYYFNRHNTERVTIVGVSVYLITFWV